MTHLSQNLQLPENTLPSAPSTDSTEMTRSDNNSSTSSSSKNNEKRYKGIRRRKWGKWASEIRVPKTRNRLWLGTYFSQEAAAMAHDTAVFCLRGTSAAKNLNFPDCIPAFLPSNLSPRSVQKAALDAGAAIDAGLASSLPESDKQATEKDAIQAGERLMWDDDDYNWSNVYQPSELGEDGSLNISVDDMEIYM